MSVWIAAEDGPPIDSPPQSPQARFESRVRSLTGAEPERLGLAVSGGPDSLALLLLAAETFPGKLSAATVDHGLRTESAAEAALVAGYCRELKVPHETLAVELAKGNLSDRARAARYAALSAWAQRCGIHHVATGHHADDQAETVLMRLNRGSGVAGLAGIRARIAIAGVNVIRPLLDWRREELAGLVAARGWNPVEDPSNCDPRFDRARLRQAIAGSDWLDPSAIAASVAHLGDADAALDWMAGRILREDIASDGDRLAMPTDLPRALALKVIAALVERIGGGSAPRGAEIARLYDALVGGRVATLAGVVARPGKMVWRFGKAPEHRA